MDGMKRIADEEVNEYAKQIIAERAAQAHEDLKKPTIMTYFAAIHNDLPDMQRQLRRFRRERLMRTIAYWVVVALFIWAVCVIAYKYDN